MSGLANGELIQREFRLWRSRQKWGGGGLRFGRSELCRGCTCGHCSRPYRFNEALCQGSDCVEGTGSAVIHETGSLSSYFRNGCRCVTCKAFVREYRIERLSRMSAEEVAAKRALKNERQRIRRAVSA